MTAHDDVQDAAHAGSTRQARATEIARAKLTWSLRVVGVRDGLHVLDAEMVTLDLCDVLEFEEPSAAVVEVVTEPPADRIAGRVLEDTIVRRAMAAVGRPAHVVVTKRIPPGAGLGGGSADAAAVLRWADHPDLATALALGSDVPFCLRGGHALVRGVGEELEPLPPLSATVTLALLPFGVDTASCYRAYDSLEGPAKHHDRNDLTRAAEQVAPALRGVRQHLEALCGSAFSLAGSGSTLFCEGDPMDLGHRGDDSVGTQFGEVRLVLARTD